MRVFVTGATGFIGSAVLRDLIGAGHDVLGLARSDAGAASLTTMGAQPHRGSLEDLDSIRAGAAIADGVIHTAFDNSELSKFKENGETERRAIDVLGSVLEGTGRPLILTSGFASLAPGRIATELDVRQPDSAASGRVSEVAATALAELGVAGAVVRLPCVHGYGDRFTVPMFIGIARKTGVSAYVGNGLNRWAAVHNIDAASVYRRALEAKVAGAW